MTDPHPTFQSETLGDVTIVTLQPADFFDQQTIAAAKRELLLFVKTEKPAKLIVRFANIQRFSSAFIRVLVNLKEHIRFHHPMPRSSSASCSRSTGRSSRWSTRAEIVQAVRYGQGRLYFVSVERRTGLAMR